MAIKQILILYCYYCYYIVQLTLYFILTLFSDMYN